jgi:phosphoglycerol transferase MdoB-like AlkP superfamily enzyme
VKEDGFMKQKLINSAILFGLFIFIILYLEILFKLRVLNFSFDGDVLRISLFSLSYSVMIMFLLMFFKEKAVKNTTYIFVIIITFLYFNQEIYSSFVEGFYSFAVVGDFTAGLSFFSDYLHAFKFGHITYLLPLGTLFLFSKYKIINFDIEYCVLKQPLFLLIISFLLFFGSLQTINENVEIQAVDDDNDVPITLNEVGTLISYSDMDLYTYMYNSQDALKKFGLLTYTQRDLFSLLRTDPLSAEAYKVLINDYFEKEALNAHDSNDYSDIFEDKNFVLIMAESLDTFAINETLTPHMWDMKVNNSYYENYYSPLYYRSTADSEFLVQTSMYPDKNVTLSMDAYMDNTFPNTMPKLFEEKGYTTYSFHNYFDYFYPRGNFHLQTLGYNQFWGSEELGLTSGFNPDRVIFDHVWESDYEMMKMAVPKFIDDDKFFVNILTVSGHFQYNDEHEMATPENVERARLYLENLEEPVEYTDEILYYLAIHIEVDNAIGYLKEELEAAGKLEDTVIMIFGDHYAYGIDNDVIWDYENEYKIDNDEMDIHNVPLLIYSDSPNKLANTSEMYFSTIDIMPTVANLFNLDINYAQVFGNDAFGMSNNIVRFADGSFISSNFRYESLSEKYTIYDETTSEWYLFGLNTAFLNQYMYNLLVLEYNYFEKKDD